MIASGEDSPEALSGFVKFHPQYPVLKVPGGACGPPCASRSRLARRCILRASPPRVKGKFGFGRIYHGARADSAEPSEFSQLAQSLPRGPCRPSLWRSLHNRGAGTGVPARFPPAERAPRPGRSGRDGKMPLRRDPPRAAPAPPTASCYVLVCDRGARSETRGLNGHWRADEGKDAVCVRPLHPRRRRGGCTSTADAGVYIAYAKASF